MSHAAIASYYDDSPLFVLGAMLPDFQGMLGIKPFAPRDAELARGVRFHHESDAAFHEAPAFLELTRTARAWLSQAGLSKGPRRAVAHIGVELLLDPILVGQGGASDAYRAALAAGAAAPAELELQPAAMNRLVELVRALSVRANPELASDTVLLVRRIRRALADRPSLALDDASEALVMNWVVEARPSVVGCASDVVRQVLSTLDARGFYRAARGGSSA
ncbi:MAG: hypothetical protein QM756_32410 [Polyangiaceae bacterium]